MSYARGLGDAAFDEAKARWEARRGIPYSGNALLASDLDAEDAILTAIANGSVDAMVQGMSHPDSAVRSIATDYLKRLADSSPAQFQQATTAGVVSADLYQQITGRSLSSEPWWRYARESAVGAALFPILGAGSGSRGGTAGNWSVGFSWDGHDIYDPAFDFAGLVAAAKQFAAAHTASIEAPTAEAVANATSTTLSPGAPSGWRYNGSTGWFGPDGKFYAGGADSTPWDGSVLGVSVNKPVQSGGGPVVSTGGESSPTPMIAPTDGLWPQPSDGLPPSDGGYVPPGAVAFDSPPADGEPGQGGTPQQAGLFSGSGALALLIGGGLIVAAMMKKKGR